MALRHTGPWFRREDWTGFCELLAYGLEAVRDSREILPRKSLKKGGPRTEILKITVLKGWLEKLSWQLEEDGQKAGGNRLYWRHRSQR